MAGSIKAFTEITSEKERNYTMPNQSLINKK
jgi:hypothetical protein